MAKQPKRHVVATTLKESRGKKDEKKPMSVLSPPRKADSREEEDVDEDEGSADKGGDDRSEEDEDDDGVDEEGMERLVELLGEDGLDDFDRSQLRSLVGEDGAEDDEDEEGDSSQEEEEGEQVAGAKVSVNGNANESGEEEEEGDDTILLDEAESVDDDVVPHQKLDINNEVALERIRETIQLDPSLPWTETLVLSYPEKINVDVDDDLNRELAFYKQALHGAQAARTLASQQSLPFTRPPDYFAEMVKSDAHMQRIRQRLLNESASIKKSEEKRKEREGKKFGKQVQIETQKQRAQSKKEIEERLKNLKRKRKDMLDNPQNTNEDFDVAIEDAISDRPSKRSKSDGSKKPRMSRQARDKKFSFGGAGRRSKQNTKESTDNFGPSAGREKKGKGGKAGKKQRPGKSRRTAARSKS